MEASHQVEGERGKRAKSRVEDSCVCERVCVFAKKEEKEEREERDGEREREGERWREREGRETETETGRECEP